MEKPATYSSNFGIWPSLSTIVLISACLLIQGCSQKKSGKDGTAPPAESTSTENQEDEKTGETEQTGGSTDQPLLGDSDLSLETTERKVRNYLELYNTMANLTGVDPETESIKSEFTDQIQGSLPTGNGAGDFTATNQVANLKLSALFCQESFNNPATRTRIFADIQSPNGDDRDEDEPEFNSDDLKPMAEALLKNLWRQDDPDPIEVDSLVGLGLVLQKVGEEPAEENEGISGNFSILERIAVGSCSAVLSSSHVFVY